MTWLQHHTVSERFAADAEIAARRGDVAEAQKLYTLAAEAEERALADLEPAKSRTRGISAVSAVSLHWKAAQVQSAERLACRWLLSQDLPDFATEQLRGLLQTIWSERVREAAKIDFAPGQVVVAVKGGEIVPGGAPLDLIVEKVQTVQALFYRTAELLLGMKHRTRGGPTRDVVDVCRPWLFQTSPGSYQFAVAVEKPRQKRLFDEGVPQPKELAHQFLRILRASVQSPAEELPAIVPNDDYRNTFLKLTRNLAPTGKRFSQLEIRSAEGPDSLTLVPGTRQALGHAIRASRPPSHEPAEEEQSLRGLLRAVHLDQDWIEITLGIEHVRVDRVGEAVDDVIGPMVNHPVIVQVGRDARGRMHFRDIEIDE